MKVRFKLEQGATMPVRKTDGALGYDLAASEYYLLQKGRFKLVETGVRMDSPVGGLLMLRSSLGVKGVVMPHGVGLIDIDYRGTLKVGMLYLGTGNGRDPEYLPINKGDRIAQIVFVQPVETEVEQVEDISETERGDGGFGSTNG